MKFTNKKKLEAIADAMRNIHIMTKAIKYQSAIVKENKSLIADADDLKSFNEMLNKCNFFTSRMDKIYSYDRKASKYLVEVNGESPIDELSMQVIEAVERVSEGFIA